MKPETGPMIRYLRLFGMYFSQYAKARLEYRADFFSSVLASFLGTAASFGFLLIVFSRVPAVQGWKFEEMVFLYGFSDSRFTLWMSSSSSRGRSAARRSILRSSSA